MRHHRFVPARAAYACVLAARIKIYENPGWRLSRCTSQVLVAYPADTAVARTSKDGEHVVAVFQLYA